VIIVKRNTLVATALVSVLVLSGSVVYALDSNSKKEITNSFKPAEVSLGVVENTATNVTETVTEKDYTLTSIVSGGTLAVDKPVQILNIDATNQNNADAFIRATIVPMWVTNSTGEVTQNFVVGAMDDIINDADNDTVVQTEVAIVSNADVTTTATVTTNVGYVADNNNEYLDISSFDLTKIDIKDNSFTLGDVTFTLASNWNSYWVFNQNDGYFYYKYVVEAGQKTEPLLASVSIDDSKLYRYNGTPITLRVDILADSIQALGGAFEDVWGDVGLTRGAETTTKEGDTTHKYGYVLETTTATTTTVPETTTSVTETTTTATE
jgi:hypothetical protein